MNSVPSATEREAFKTLALPVSATQSQIKRSYRHKSLSSHPDKGFPAEDFQRIQDAYNTAINFATASQTQENQRTPDYHSDLPTDAPFWETDAATIAKINAFISRPKPPPFRAKQAEKPDISQTLEHLLSEKVSRLHQLRRETINRLQTAKDALIESARDRPETFSTDLLALQRQQREADAECERGCAAALEQVRREMAARLEKGEQANRQ